MDKIIYYRPREKLQAKGVGSLSTAELVQVILGSGSKGRSVAKISRQVADSLGVLAGRELTDKLLLINGMGIAKVSQLVASIELGRRLTSTKESKKPSPYSDWLKGTVGLAKRLTIRYCLLSGDGSVVSKHEYIPAKSEHYLYVVRKILAKSIIDGVDAVALSYGSSIQSAELSTYDIGFIRSFYDQSDILGLRVESVVLVHGGGFKLVRRRDVSPV